MILKYVEPGSDILIDNDKSISREHAKITVGTPADVELDQTKKKTKISKPDISIKDSSKYGVEVNNTKLGKSLKMLQHGDTIKFGVYQSVFKYDTMSIFNTVDSSMNHLYFVDRE